MKLDPLRFFKFMTFLLMSVSGALIFAGRELERGNLRVVSTTVGVAFVVAGFLALVSSVLNRRIVYEISYAVTNFSLSTWTFVLVVYASFGITPWGRVVVFAYILLQNLWMLPYLMNVQLARNSLIRASDVAHDAEEGYNRRRKIADKG